MHFLGNLVSASGPLLLTAALCAQAPQAFVGGLVKDVNGAPIPNVRVFAMDSPSQFTLTDATGAFRLPVSGGPFFLHIESPGLYTVLLHADPADPKSQTLDITLTKPAILAGPSAESPLLLSDESVTVTATQHDVAQAEIKVEEQQRLFGAIPNFYVSYDWQAAPLDKHQKFELGWRSVVDPVTIGLNAVAAGIEQATDEFPGYHQGAAGYFKRFGAANADTATGTFLGGFLYPALFHQDPRYFYSGRGSITHRTLYALSTAFRQRGDNGKWQPAYASILGDLSEGAVSNLYYPASDRHGATLTFENGLISIGSDAIGNVIQEFLLRHLTRKPPTYPQN